MSKRDDEKLKLFMINFGEAKRHSSPLILWPPLSFFPFFNRLKSLSFYNSPNLKKFAWAQPPFAWNSSWFWHKKSSSKLNRLSQLYSLNTFPSYSCWVWEAKMLVSTLVLWNTILEKRGKVRHAVSCLMYKLENCSLQVDSEDRSNTYV